MAVIKRIYWNTEYEVYEALHTDGFHQILSDQYEAWNLAKECGLEVEGLDPSERRWLMENDKKKP